MPIPRAVARLNKVGLNRLTVRVMPYLPGFGVVEHRGRRSGRTFRTPVNVFPQGDTYVIALTYGPDVDWVKNVLAAGECHLTTRGRRHHLASPRQYHDETRSGIRPVERAVLGLLQVFEVLELRIVP